ncbi:MAG: hypothetical protein AAF423_13815, partial [Pseudomonadota bacterium]
QTPPSNLPNPPFRALINRKDPLNLALNALQVIVIGTPVQMGKEYLAAVGALARLLKEESLRRKLIAAQNAEEFHFLIETAEKEA